MSELEETPLVDQQTHAALILLASRPEFFAGHGSIDANFRRRDGRTYGPYFRLRYREAGRAHSVYLGLAGPLVDRVRQTLQSLQAPLRQHRAILQLQRCVRNALRLDRSHLDAQLRTLGLRMQGFEVRGWRSSPLTSLARLARTARNATASLRIKPFRPPTARQLFFAPKRCLLTHARRIRLAIPKLHKLGLKHSPTPAQRDGPDSRVNENGTPPFTASISQILNQLGRRSGSTAAAPNKST
jgi:hypothetical protein